MPRRAEIVRARVEEVGLGPVVPPGEHDLATARRVHAPDYLEFLPRAWPLWAAAGRGGTAMPFVWPVPGLRADRPPADIDGLLGFYTMDAGATFVEGTWEAVKASHDVALTAAGLVAGGERAAFALCRPPGHHAGRAVRRRLLLRQQRRGRRRAAARARARRGCRSSTSTITTATARRRSSGSARDVQVVNIHADPMVEYPYFLGHADERGGGGGRGVQPQPAAAARHRVPGLVGGARRRRSPRWPASGRRRWWCRSGSTPSAATRSAGSASTPPTIRRSARASPGSACRRCSCWRAAMRWRRSG